MVNTEGGKLGSTRNQILATLCVCLTAASYGANCAITSAVIFAFQKDTDDHIKMTLEDASWLPTLFFLATIPGCLIGGVIADKWGKKLTMFASNLLAYACWILTAYANDRYLLYSTYSLQGFFGSIAFNCVGIYIAETAEASLRRIVGPFSMVGVCLGFLLGYSTSAFLPWRMCKLIVGSLVTLPAALLILLFHETPHWLVKKGKLDNARHSMIFYRGKSHTNRESELQSIIELAENSDRHRNKDSFRGNLLVLLSPAFLRPFKCVGILGILLSMSGVFVISTYTHTFMEMASEQEATSISPEYQAIIQGGFRLAGSLLAPLILLKLKKRRAFCIFGVLASLSLATVAIYNHLAQMLPVEARDYMLKNFFHIPLIVSHIPTLCNVMALYTTLGVLRGELFPTKIRATACGIVSAMSNLILVANNKFFPKAVASFGFHYVMYFYAVITAIMVAWGFLSIKDTDRLSLTEIQDMHKKTEVTGITQSNKEGKEERDEDNFNAIGVKFVKANEDRGSFVNSILNEPNCYINPIEVNELGDMTPGKGQNDGKRVGKKSVLNHANPLKVNSNNETEDKKEGRYSRTVCEAINVR